MIHEKSIKIMWLVLIESTEFKEIAARLSLEM